MLRKSLYLSSILALIAAPLYGQQANLSDASILSYDHATQAAVEVLGGGAAPCDDCSGDYCDCSGSGCAWRAGVDVLIVQPYFDNGVDYFVGGQEFQNGVLTETDQPSLQDPDWDYEAAPRVWIAFESACGRGIRARYFNFDHESNVIVDLDEDDPGFRAEVSGDLDMHAVDVDLYQRICLGPADLSLSGGFRFGKVDLTRIRTGFENGGATDLNQLSNTDFEGFGPTFAIETSVPITCQTSIIGGVRSSLLFGETKMGLSNLSDNELQLLQMNEQDDMVFVLEGQLGIERSFCLGCGVLRVNALAEAQFWGNAVHNGLLFPGGFPEQGGPPFLNDRNTADSSVGLFGLTVGLIYER